MSLTLVEAAKVAANNGEDFRSAIIELYARSSDILRVLPFQDIDGSALKYNREETLPGVGFRGVNEAYTESTGVVNPIVEPLVIAGGKLDVDRYILKTMGENQRSIQEAMKIKALSLAWTKTFIKGSNSTEPREFDGLQTRFIGDQLIAAGATSGGDALSLAKLDELVDVVDEPGFLVMSKAMRRLLSTAARTAAVGGDLQWDKDDFGAQVAIYSGLPILIGIQNKGIDVADLGEQADPVFRTRIEWYNGIALFHGQAGGRLHGIKNAAVTA
jgi:hypothetical protein